MLPLVVTVLGAGDGVPGLNAYKTGHTGFAPDEGVGECGNIAYHTSAGTLFIDTQSLGSQTNHTVAVVVKQMRVDRDRICVVGKIIGVALERPVGWQFRHRGDWGVSNRNS